MGTAVATTHVTVPYAPRCWADPFHDSYARWSCLVLHRRAGKTTAVINHHQRAALDDAWERTRLRHLKPEVTDANLTELLRGRFYAHILPTYRQAKLTTWDMAKYFATPIPGVTFNEAELRIDYPNGSKLQLFGSDKPDRLRGLAFSGVSFDEYGMHPPNVFSEVVSKALADHLGYAIFAGTIKGRNQLYQTYEALKDDDAAFTLWQDINTSLKTEEDASTLMLSRAYADDLELITKGLMTQEEFDQEWLLSTDAAIKGAYYTTQLAAARKEKRVTRVPYDPALPVDTDWDLGVGDSTVIWFTQSLRSGEVHVIDYYENSGEGIPHYAKVIQEKPYVYGEHWAPHDIRARELGSGKSRLETAEKHRIKFQVTPNIGVDDGIDAARLLIPRCWFDAEKCSVGLEALTFYRKAFNERMQTFTDKPLHDWTSHAADAFRGLAVRHKPPRSERSKPRRPSRKRDLWAGRLPPAGRQGWMH